MIDPSPELVALSRRYPSSQSALAEIANLESVLTLPVMTVHVVSDVHGEHVKFRHVVNNASGSLRPRLLRLFAGRLDEAQIAELLSLFYYPAETWQKIGGGAARLRSFMERAMEVMRDLSRGYTLKHVTRILPDPFDNVFLELLFAPALERSDALVSSLLETFSSAGRELELVRLTARAVRNLSVGELVVAGDIGDRGPRIDRVIEVMMHQPACSIAWGNHDMAWMGACLGHPALIATVLRVSLRYRRLGQLEEGYGITMAPVEHLAATVYGDDPAEAFAVKGHGLRDPRTMARMQKAMAILQFKLEGQLVRRHPAWGLEGRALLHRIDPAAGTVTIDGVPYPLTDARLPTIDWADPYRLSPEEEMCLRRVRESFLASARLWEQMRFCARHGALWLQRDPCLIFHGCVPVDEEGAFQSLSVDGEPRRGRALFDALERVVHRGFRDRREEDLDFFWYLWAGPLSPCFGKDRMATFETYFVSDKTSHKETKNPYFKLIHDPAFCARVLGEFGAPEDGLIVNGHVPVRPEKGEEPVKKGGGAVTIDGAFAAAYGDRGYSLVIGAEGVTLAQHHHFAASVDEAVETYADIIPEVSTIRAFPAPRRVGDTEKGAALREEIAVLRRLIQAYQDNVLREADAPRAAD